MGFLSDNHILENLNGQKYFLKKYRSKYSLADVEYIHKVKQFFYDGGVPVILPLKNSVGQFTFQFEESIYALFPFVSGLIFDRSRRTPEIDAEAGRMLGRIHLLGMKCELDKRDQLAWSDAINFEKVVQEILEIINKIEPKRIFDYESLELLNLQKDLVPVAKAIMNKYELNSNCLIHGDFHDKNIFYDEAGKITHVFDFEKACFAPRSFELARALDYMCLGSGYNNYGFKQAIALLRGYQKVFPISYEEFKMGFDIYYSKQILTVWVVTEHYFKGNTRVDEFNRTLFDALIYLKEHYVEAVKRIYFGD